MDFGEKSLGQSELLSEDENPASESRMLDGMMTISQNISYFAANKGAIPDSHEDKICNGHIKTQKNKTQAIYIPIPAVNQQGLEVYPSEIHFNGFIVGVAQTCSLKITNISNTAQKFDIFATANDNFEFQFTKKGKLAKGANQAVMVKFIASSYQLYETVLRIQHAKTWLIIPIKAYPTITYQREKIFPETVSFQWREIGQVHLITRRIKSFIGLDCNFEIVTTNACDQISIVPDKGIIPANGFTEIQFFFRPEFSHTPIHRVEANVR